MRLKSCTMSPLLEFLINKNSRLCCETWAKRLCTVAENTFGRSSYTDVLLLETLLLTRFLKMPPDELYKIVVMEDCDV